MSERSAGAAAPREGQADDVSAKDELTIEELRQLAENPNFNLTSVLQNPRGSTATSMSSILSELMEFDPTKALFGDDFENELDHGRVLPPPPVPLPPVTADMFAGYLDRHSRGTASFLANHRAPAAEGGSADGDGDSSCGGGGGGGGGGGEGKGRRALAPHQVFAEVPALFQKAHFTLAEPDVFEKVVLLAPEDRQAQLTHYLDLVECSLLHQISSRQESFFEALSNLQALRRDVSEACTTVAALRASSEALQRHMVSGTMRVPQLARRRANLGRLQAHLERVARLHEAYEAVQALFEAADFVSALAVIKEAQRTIRAELPSVKCLGSVAK